MSQLQLALKSVDNSFSDTFAYDGSGPDPMVYTIFSGASGQLRTMNSAPKLNGKPGIVWLAPLQFDDGRSVNVWGWYWIGTGESGLPDVAGNYPIVFDEPSLTLKNFIIREVWGVDQATPFVGLQTNTAGSQANDATISTTLLDQNGVGLAVSIFATADNSNGNVLIPVSPSNSVIEHQKLLEEPTTPMALQFFTANDHVVEAASEDYTWTIKSNGASIDAVVAATVVIKDSGANIDLALTGPDEVEEGAAEQLTGVGLDTYTGLVLKTSDDAFSVAQSDTAVTDATLDFAPDTGRTTAVPGTPANGIPLTPTKVAGGFTPYSLEVEITDGTVISSRPILINPPAGYEVMQVMAASANTTDGESVFGTSLIAVEDNMQVLVPVAADGVNLTWSTDGTALADAGTEVTDTAYYFSPENGEWSALDFTISAYAAGADVTPDQFDLGADVEDAPLGTEYKRSFTVAGVAPATDILFEKLSAAEVSIDDVSYFDSVNAQLGDTVYVKGDSSSTFLDARVFGVTANGVYDFFVVKTQDVDPPVITLQPDDVTVNDGVTHNFTIAATGFAPLTYQWRENGQAMAGETSTTLSVLANKTTNGNSYDCVVTTGEGGVATSDAAVLTVTPLNVVLNLTILDINTGAPVASSAVSDVIIRDPADTSIMVAAQEINTDASGISSISSTTAVLFSIGQTVLVDFPDSGSGQRHMYPVTIEAA